MTKAQIKKRIKKINKQLETPEKLIDNDADRITYNIGIKLKSKWFREHIHIVRKTKKNLFNERDDLETTLKYLNKKL